MVKMDSREYNMVAVWKANITTAVHPPEFLMF